MNDLFENLVAALLDATEQERLCWRMSETDSHAIVTSIQLDREETLEISLHWRGVDYILRVSSNVSEGTFIDLDTQRMQVEQNVIENMFTLWEWARLQAACSNENVLRALINTLQGTP